MVLDVNDFRKQDPVPLIIKLCACLYNSIKSTKQPPLDCPPHLFGKKLEAKSLHSKKACFLVEHKAMNHVNVVKYALYVVERSLSLRFVYPQLPRQGRNYHASLGGAFFQSGIWRA